MYDGGLQHIINVQLNALKLCKTFNNCVNWNSLSILKVWSYRTPIKYLFLFLFLYVMLSEDVFWYSYFRAVVEIDSKQHTFRIFWPTITDEVFSEKFFIFLNNYFQVDAGFILFPLFNLFLMHLLVQGCATFCM